MGVNRRGIEPPISTFCVALCHWAIGPQEQNVFERIRQGEFFTPRTVTVTAATLLATGAPVVPTRSLKVVSITLPCRIPQIHSRNTFWRIGQVTQLSGSCSSPSSDLSSAVSLDGDFFAQMNSERGCVHDRKPWPHTSRHSKHTGQSPKCTHYKNHITVFNIIRTKTCFRIRIAYSIYFNSTLCRSQNNLLSKNCIKHSWMQNFYILTFSFLLIIDVQHSLQELRPISTPWLNTLLCFHLVPINLIISQGT